MAPLDGAHIRLLLADDHEIVRDGLRALLEKEDGMEVVADVSDGRAAVELATTLKPDVVIMDISMPDLNGIDATRRITAEAPGVSVLCLSMHSEDRFVAAMLSAGACGYLLKDCAAKDLVTAVRTVASGQTYLSPDIAGAVVKQYVRGQSAAAGSAFSEISDREREVLQLIAEGLSTKEIATRLFVSEKTIATHREHIMQKLGVHSIAELTKYALREGLTPL